MSANPIDTSMLPLGHGTRRVAPEELRGVTHLRLRWELDPELRRFSCAYELVIALDSSDIRREVYEDGADTGERVDVAVAEINRSWRGPGRDPCVMWPEPFLFYDPPGRDGKHAEWDAAKLGKLPVYVVALDGQYLAQEPQA